jgi:hypothetical protein
MPDLHFVTDDDNEDDIAVAESEAVPHEGALVEINVEPGKSELWKVVRRRWRIVPHTSFPATVTVFVFCQRVR